MRIGVNAEPEGRVLYQRSYYVFEKDSGAIVSVHLVAGATGGVQPSNGPQSWPQSRYRGEIVTNLGILADPRIPEGKGKLLVDPGNKRLVRGKAGASLRFGP